MSPVLIIALLLALGLVIFLALRFRGTGTIVIKPPQLNHSSGTQDVTTADAAASQTAQTSTGECQAAAAVDGLGAGSARAAVGHEFQYTGNQPKTFRVLVNFDYRTLVKVDDGPARATAIVNAILVPESPNFANDVQVAVGQKENPPGGGFTSESHEFRVTLDPNESFIVDVEVSVRAESTDPADAAACSAEAVARVTQITLIPVP